MTVVVGASLTSDEEAYDNLMRHGGKGSIAEIGKTLFVVEARRRAM